MAQRVCVMISLMPGFLPDAEEFISVAVDSRDGPRHRRERTVDLPAPFEALLADAHLVARVAPGAHNGRAQAQTRMRPLHPGVDAVQPGLRLRVESAIGQFLDAVRQTPPHEDLAILRRLAAKQQFPFCNQFRQFPLLQLQKLDTHLRVPVLFTHDASPCG